MHTRARWRLRLPVRAFARNIRIGCLLDVDGAAVGDGQKSGEAPVAVVCEGCTGLRTSPLIQPARTHPPPSPPPPQSSFSTPALSCSLHPCVRWFKRLALPPSIHPTPRPLPPSLPPSIHPSLEIPGSVYTCTSSPPAVLKGLHEFEFDSDAFGAGIEIESIGARKNAQTSILSRMPRRGCSGGALAETVAKALPEVAVALQPPRLVNRVRRRRDPWTPRHLPHPPPPPPPARKRVSYRGESFEHHHAAL